MRSFGNGAGNYMQMTFGSDAEPGMPAVMKRLRDSIKPNNIFIEISTGFQVDDIKSNMIKPGSFCADRDCVKATGKDTLMLRKTTVEIFFIINYFIK